MRALLITAVLFSAILAGCTSKTDSHNDSFTCPDGTILDLGDYPDHDNATFNATSKCPPKSGGTGNSTTSTPSTPNVLPTLVFTVTNGGNETNITTVGGNLTFSGIGSVDPDGNITGMAMSVTDANGTRTESLFDFNTGTFADVTLAFSKAGIVEVGVAVVDDRGGFATLSTLVFVDQIHLLSVGLTGAAPANQAASSFPACVGPVESNSPSPNATGAVDPTYFKRADFAVPDNASWIEAKTTSTSAYMAICSPDPDGSGPQRATDLTKARGTNIVTKDGIELPAALGINLYGIGVYRTGGTSDTIPITVTVHYGPKPAA